MNRRIVFRTQALREVTEAADWYKQRGSALEAAFIQALDATIASILLNP